MGTQGPPCSQVSPAVPTSACHRGLFLQELLEQPPGRHWSYKRWDMMIPEVVSNLYQTQVSLPWLVPISQGIRSILS